MLVKTRLDKGELGKSEIWSGCGERWKYQSAQGQFSYQMCSYQSLTRYIAGKDFTTFHMLSLQFYLIHRRTEPKNQCQYCTYDICCM